LNDSITPAQVYEELDERLASLAESLLKKRTEAIEGRAASGIERQWREDQRAFEGIDGTVGKTDMLDFATGDAWLGSRDKTQRRSKVIVNIIRGKCETAEGRFNELQFPTDDKNWGLLPTPVPVTAVPLVQPPTPAQPPQQQMAQPAMDPAAQAPMGATGMVPQAPQISDQAKADDVKKRCSAMETEIADQLEECQFNAEGRKVVRSAVRLGTGVLKGPNVVKNVRKAWIEQTDGVDSVHVMKMVEELAPASTSRDIWNIYPDPHCGNDPKRGAYIWERDHVLPREVRALIGVKGYNTRQLIRVLEEEPLRTTVQIDKGGSQKAVATKTTKGAPYERWEYHGDVDKTDLEAIGCTCPDGPGSSYAACIVFINDHPVKVQLNTLDTGELPYDFFPWVEIEDSPWGIGEPRKIIWQQRIITAAWRQMMDNAGDSSGAQIIIGANVVPEDGQWEVTGKKIWVDESEDGDVRASFTQYQIQNNQVELQNIIELALRFTDLESGTPALAQGEKGSSPETLGGMKMLMQGADTGRRDKVKRWDDQITTPHIGRYYDWNMQYNPKQEIKGDFQVDARGTSVLLVKDETAQSLMQVLSLRADPEVNIQVDWGKVIKQLFQARHLDVLKSDDEIKAARDKAAKQPPPPMPQVQVAEIREKGATERKQMELQAEAQQSQLDRDLEQRIQEIDARLELTTLASEERRDLEKQKVLLASLALKLKTQTDLSLAGHTVNLHQSRQALEAPVEPAGQAPAGMSFTQ
jgi:hypothetical protein